MFKGFKDFILRGNVIELSIAVVVGTAFTALVAAFTTNIVNPIIAAAGGVETQGLGFHIWPGNEKTFVNVGGVLNGCRELFGWTQAQALSKIDDIYDTILSIYQSAQAQSIATNKAADGLAEERLRAGSKAKCP